jgi:hypothetical protein
MIQSMNFLWETNKKKEQYLVVILDISFAGSGHGHFGERSSETFPCRCERAWSRGVQTSNTRLGFRFSETLFAASERVVAPGSHYHTSLRAAPAHHTATQTAVHFPHQ